MQQGDLVHIPQGVLLHVHPDLNSPFYKTERPLTALVMGHSAEERVVQVFAAGSVRYLAEKNAYQMEDGC